MKEKIIITISRVFPVTHSRRGEPTNFAERLRLGDKKHTILSDDDIWMINAEKVKRGKCCLSICQWSGKTYNSKQVEIARTHNPIGIQPVEIYYHAYNDTVTAKIDGREFYDADCYTLAKNDGLSVQDFKEWFFGKDPKGDKVFKGVIIHFTDFRY